MCAVSKCTVSFLKLLCGRQEAVPWEHKEITVMGRRVMQPRLVAYMADDVNLQYTYSHTTLTPHLWSPAVAAVKVKASIQSTVPA